MVNEVKLQVAQTLGRHNADLSSSVRRLETANSYRDLSTICVLPTHGNIYAKVVQNWMSHINQMNQKFVRIPTICTNKYDGVNNVIYSVVSAPGISDFKYILILEEDAMPPFDGLLKLYENIEKYDVVGSLMWDKGENGRPMIYGYPNSIPQNYLPAYPMSDSIQPCLAVSTGFTLFKMDIFKDPRLPRPWFLTNEIKRPELYFFENIHKLGYTVACDTRVKVGHYDPETDIVW